MRRRSRRHRDEGRSHGGKNEAPMVHAVSKYNVARATPSAWQTVIPSRLGTASELGSDRMLVCIFWRDFVVAIHHRRHKQHCAHNLITKGRAMCGLLHPMAP